MNPEELAEKARKKELHRKSMIWTGAMIACAALAAGWIGFAPSRLLPKVGRQGQDAMPADVPLGPMLVEWAPFSPKSLDRARKLDRLVLLSLTAAWSKPCRRLEGETFAEPKVAELLARDFVAVRADADERPDLRLRYLAGYPTTALLLPSGQILDAGTYMGPRVLENWATTILGKYRERREGVLEAAQKALADGAKPSKAAADPREALLSEPTGAVFPRFDRLRALSRVPAPWARQLEARLLEGSRGLEDKERGGFYRDRRPDGALETEKLLGDQADALAYLAKAEPEAAARLRRFVAGLAGPRGGWTLGLAFDGKRDERVFCDENGRMAAAMLLDPAAEKETARRALSVFWAARRGGLAPRRLGGDVYGLLGDQLGLMEGLLAAGRTSDAKALAAAVERALLDEKGEAFYDRPARGELPPGLDRLRTPALNMRAWRLWSALKSPRAGALRAWLSRHETGLDAADVAELRSALPASSPKPS